MPQREPQTGRPLPRKAGQRRMSTCSQPPPCKKERLSPFPTCPCPPHPLPRHWGRPGGAQVGPPARVLTSCLRGARRAAAVARRPTERLPVEHRHDTTRTPVPPGAGRWGRSLGDPPRCCRRNRNLGVHPRRLLLQAGFWEAGGWGTASPADPAHLGRGHTPGAPAPVGAGQEAGGGDL